MNYLARIYGKTIEITEIEKQPFQVRIRSSRKRSSIHYPRRFDNIRRSRQILLRRVSTAIASFGCPLLLTLTFAGDASDASFANDSLRRFQVRLRDRFPGCHSVFVPELSPRGRIHFHGLLFQVPLHYGDKKKNRRTVSFGTERSTREFARLWGEGFVDAVQTDGSFRLAGYLSKYITKSASETLFIGMRLIRISHGFPREDCYRDSFAQFMAMKFSSISPVSEWSCITPFFGRISKKYYRI